MKVYIGFQSLFEINPFRLKTIKTAQREYGKAVSYTHLDVYKRQVHSEC